MSRLLLPGAAATPGSPLPADPLEREALAHRLVAERCLYGVDKNPMAVEMAKLSLWLITLAKDRPFSFVDHALRAGDSLLGITDLRQLRVAHLDPGWHRQASLDLGFGEIEAAVDRALDAPPRPRGVRRPRHPRRRAQSHAARRGRRRARRRAAARRPRRRRGARRSSTTPTRSPRPRSPVACGRWSIDEAPELDRTAARTQLRALADGWLVERRRAVGEVAEVVWDDRDPFHWALEFPEVQAHGGFDAIVGNPPFQGGQKITGALGGAVPRLPRYAGWRAACAAAPTSSPTFTCAPRRLLRPSGGFGLIATNTVAQGDTREVGLDQLVDGRLGLSIERVSSAPWPGAAGLEMATVWARRDGWAESACSTASRLAGSPRRSPCAAGSAAMPHRLHAEPGPLVPGFHCPRHGICALARRG